MKTKTSYLTCVFRYVALFGIAISFCSKVLSQPQFSTYMDFGENNVSEGSFIKTAGFGSYRLEKTRIAGGLQFDLISPSATAFTGSEISIAREILIKDFSFVVEGLFIYNPFSRLVHETNWGVLAKTRGKHFTYKLGTNFRSFRVTRKAIEEHNINANKKLHEKWNLMYLLRYNLKPPDSPWNAGVSLSNIDHFIINQETNPEFYLHGSYTISEPLTVFIETWYKSAGSFNISVNYFGFFIRTGIIWKLDIDT